MSEIVTQNPTEDLLCNMYVDGKMTIAEIANRFNISEAATTTLMPMNKITRKLEKKRRDLSKWRETHV